MLGGYSVQTRDSIISSTEVSFNSLEITISPYAAGEELFVMRLEEEVEEDDDDEAEVDW